MPEKQPPQKPLKNTDQKLWDIATSDVTQIAQKSISPKPIRPRKMTKKSQGVSLEAVGFIELEIFKPRTQKPAPTLEKSSFQIDAALKKRFERGDLPLDGKIDLHGLTLEQAHRKFLSFIHTKIAAGARFILIVTGKGVGGEGIIRKSLPLWCDSAEIKQHILQRTEAKPHHGGSGATYILLRKSK